MYLVTWNSIATKLNSDQQKEKQKRRKEDFTCPNSIIFLSKFRYIHPIFSKGVKDKSRPIDPKSGSN